MAAGSVGAERAAGDDVVCGLAAGAGSTGENGDGFGFGGVNERGRGIEAGSAVPADKNRRQTKIMSTNKALYSAISWQPHLGQTVCVLADMGL